MVGSSIGFLKAHFLSILPFSLHIEGGLLADFWCFPDIFLVSFPFIGQVLLRRVIIQLGFLSFFILSSGFGV